MGVLTIDLTQHTDKIVNDILRGDIYGALSVNDVMPDIYGNIHLTLDDIPDTSIRNLSDKADKSNTLEGYGIEDAYTQTEIDSYLKNKVSYVNGNSPDNTGNVAVQAFTGITSWFTSSEYYKVSTSTFCNALRLKIQQKFPDYKYDQCGLAFMFKGACFTDFPNSFIDRRGYDDPKYWDIATGELFIYVISENLFYIDMYTTNNFQKKGDEGQTDTLDAGKFTSIYDFGYNDNNHMRMLWNASLLCPQHLVPLADGRYTYIPTKDYHAVSFYYLKQFAEANNLILPEN